MVSMEGLRNVFIENGFRKYLLDLFVPLSMIYPVYLIYFIVE